MAGWRRARRLLVLAARVVDGRLRVFFLATAAVSVGGVVFAEIFGDLIPSLLVIQAQFWRAGWLAAALAPAALAILVVDASKKPASAWLAPAMLALVWAPIDDGVKFVACGAAIFTAFAAERGMIRLSERQCRVIAGLLLLSAAFVSVVVLSSLYGKAIRCPDGVYAIRARMLKSDIQSWPLAAIACVLVLARPGAWVSALRGALALALVAAAATGWDCRSEYKRALDSARPIEQFTSILKEKPGEIYWTRGAAEAWYWAGRPNWLASIQGAGIVFSREEAMFWKERAYRVADLGLESWKIIEPWSDQEENFKLTSAKLRAFCAYSDAPPWVVWRLEDDETPPSEIAVRAVWQSPDTPASYRKKGQTHDWEKVRIRFALISCDQTAAPR